MTEAPAQAQASPPAQNLPPRTPLPARQEEHPDRSFANMVLINVTGDEEAEAQQLRKAFAASGKGYLILLAVNYLCLFVGSVSASLLSKFYFNHKGSSRWLCTFVQSAGFPVLIPVVYLPFHLFKCTQRRPFAGFNSQLLIFSITIGFLLGINNLLFSWGTSYLPVSTSSLLLSSQLAFNLILSVIIVKTKVTFQNLNCVILLTLGSVLLALGSNHDRPAGLSRAKYFIGFFSTIGAGLMFALYLPVMEVIYKKVYCYAMVMEMQLVMEVAATGLAAVGMAADGGFMEIGRESRIRFDLGPGAYWWTVAGNLVTWQLCFVGTAGMVFLTTSVTSGICMTALMGMNVIAGVLVFGDEFGGAKVVSTLLCGWGFCSYVYGMYVKKKKEKEQAESKAKSNGGGHVHDQDHQSMDMTQNVTASGV